MIRILIYFILTILFFSTAATAQPSLTFDLKKPPKFENKTLASEKTGNKKFTVPRRFIQNTVTHYNFYFNANNRLNEIIDRAKAAHQDDYTQLLSFYNYNLQMTAGFKTDLDSVIYKSTAGILIHDLRNDWIDNLYLLIGRAYFLRNQLDSAFLTFQYINYAFSPKEKDGYDKVIGTHEAQGSNTLSISTKEKSNIVKNAFSEPPSRNESLVWQIKTYLAGDDLAEAAGLIETLKNDPAFPGRLQPDLEEVQAHLFYKQQAYDSAAFHLEKALDNASGKAEQARWEYLAGQLYELSGKPDLAEKFFNRTIRHTLNPVLEVYARLNAIRQDRSGNDKAVNEAIDALVKMARKDRYRLYRDIIYYTAATIEMERNNPEGAKALLLRSVKSSTDNTSQKSRSYMALGDIGFDKKNYPEAKGFYDSVNVQLLKLTDEKAFTNRKTALEKIVYQSAIIYRQDSLQRIAAMPKAERDAFIKALVKQFRKQQGVRDDDSRVLDKGNLGNSPAANDLFSNSSGKGDWYFSNASLKGKGLGEFKTKWGNRPNTDNWRRQAAISRTSGPQTQAGGVALKATEPYTPIEISYDAFLDKLPLTPEKQKASLDSTEHSLFYLGKALMDGLEDYASAITALEKLLNTFPVTVHREEALFNLYYCYSKTGNRGNQAKVKDLLATKFPGGKFSSLLNITSMSQSPDSILKTKATAEYQKVYDLFIEGNFREALNRKKQADVVYGQNFWTPQLLYIEGVYYIRQREDSTARRVLTSILQLFPTSPMFQKTNNLLAVLGRRKEIEDYLTNLKLDTLGGDNQGAGTPLVQNQNTVPSKEELQKRADAEKAAKELLLKKQQEALAAEALKVKKEQADSTSKALQAQRDQADIAAKELKAKIQQAESAAKELQAKREEAERSVRDSLQKKLQDAEIAARELQQKKEKEEIAAKELQQKIQQEEIIAKELLQKKQQEEIVARELQQKKEQAEIAASEAQQKQREEIAARELKNKKRVEETAARELSAKKVKASDKKAGTDSAKITPPVAIQPAGKTDSLKPAAKPPVVNAVYSNNAAERHYVVLVLDKVDPVYVTEARNAFNRYHRESYNGKAIEVTPFSLSDDTKLVLMSGFENAAVALSYIEKTKMVSQTEIIPWLTAQKYSFILISASNLEILKTKKDIPDYRKFLRQLYPDQF